MTAAYTDAFLNTLDIRYGPKDLLTHYFLAAADEVSNLGVKLELSTFEVLEEVSKSQLDSRRPLLSTFQRELGGASEGVVLIGRNEHGQPVATQAVRLFDWSDSNLKDEAEALRLFYSDPKPARLKGESCLVTADEAPKISGLVGFGGAVWCHPDLRGSGIVTILPRIGRAYALARFDIDGLIALFVPDNIKKKVHEKVGFKRVSEALVRKCSPLKPEGDVPMAICHQDSMDIVDDVFGYLLDRQRPEVDTGIEKRRA